eukprot:scaffold13659_cov54-Attheya_sp.AAC.3
MSTPTLGVASPVLVPQTGLGILLDGRTFAPVGTTITAMAPSLDSTAQNNKANANNGNLGGAAGFKINHHPGMAHSTLEVRKRMQQDLVDRERQASSLAAAGMVAETVSRSRSYGSLDYHNHSNQGGNGSAMSSPLRHVSSSQGPLASQPELGPLTSTLSPGGTHVTNIIHGTNNTHNNTDDGWGNMMDLGGCFNNTLEDMELDFAKLFDPQQEVNSMQTEGSGWPIMCDSSSLHQSDDYTPNRIENTGAASTTTTSSNSMANS